MFCVGKSNKTWNYLRKFNQNTADYGYRCLTAIFFTALDYDTFNKVAHKLVIFKNISNTKRAQKQNLFFLHQQFIDKVIIFLRLYNSFEMVKYCKKPFMFYNVSLLVKHWYLLLSWNRLDW